MSEKLSESKMMQVLDWGYDKAINGVAGLDSAIEIAEDYMSKEDSLVEQANSLIRWQVVRSLFKTPIGPLCGGIKYLGVKRFSQGQMPPVSDALSRMRDRNPSFKKASKAGTSGFLTGLPGLLAMPVTIPASISSVLYVQIRMIAAIAHIGGHDLKDDRVKSLVYVCLAGNAAREILKDIGIVIGTKLTTNAIRNISGKTIVAINQKVGFRLLTKFGERGAVNLGKAVPLIGGVVGGTVDSVTTNTIGNIARDTFINE